MGIFVIDFFNQYRQLGGTEMDSNMERAVTFAHDGLARHDAAWARVLDQDTGLEKRLCARALATGHDINDPRICRQEPLCAVCPVLAKRWTTDADEDCGWCAIA